MRLPPYNSCLQSVSAGWLLPFSTCTVAVAGILLTDGNCFCSIWMIWILTKAARPVSAEGSIASLMVNGSNRQGNVFEGLHCSNHCAQASLAVFC